MQNLEHYKSKIRQKLSPILADALLSIEQMKIPDEQKIAAFDLDGTLINGDIGESTFCYLKSIGHEFDFTWSEYLELLKTCNHRLAYSKLVTTMQGLLVKVVSNASRRLITSKSDTIFFTENNIDYSYPIPKQVVEMHNLIVYLKISGWKIAVISASNHISVRAVCEELFKLKPDFIRGIRTEIEVSDNSEDYFTDIIKGQISYGIGKVEVFHQLFGSNAIPLITAGDSAGDIDLMNLTSTDGFALLCSSSTDSNLHLKAKIKSDIQLIEFHLT